jgi:nucleoside-diphosphate-sugar epimerase
MYQGDLAHWLWVMLDRGADNRAYNVGSDQPTSILDLAVRVRDLLAPEKPILMGGGADGHQGRNRYIPSIIRAKEEG